MCWNLKVKFTVSPKSVRLWTQILFYPQITQAMLSKACLLFLFPLRAAKRPTFIPSPPFFMSCLTSSMLFLSLLKPALFLDFSTRAHRRALRCAFPAWVPWRTGHSQMYPPNITRWKRESKFFDWSNLAGVFQMTYFCIKNVFCVNEVYSNWEVCRRPVYCLCTQNIPKHEWGTMHTSQPPWNPHWWRSKNSKMVTVLASMSIHELAKMLLATAGHICMWFGTQL